MFSTVDSRTMRSLSFEKLEGKCTGSSRCFSPRRSLWKWEC